MEDSLFRDDRPVILSMQEVCFATVGTLLTNAIQTITELITAPTFTEPLQAHAFYSIKKIANLDTAYSNALYFALGGSSTNMDQQVTKSANLLIHKFKTFRDHFGLNKIFERFSTASHSSLKSLLSFPEFNLLHHSNNIHEMYTDVSVLYSQKKRAKDINRLRRIFHTTLIVTALINELQKTPLPLKPLQKLSPLTQSSRRPLSLSNEETERKEVVKQVVLQGNVEPAKNLVALATTLLQGIPIFNMENDLKAAKLWIQNATQWDTFIRHKNIYDDDGFCAWVAIQTRMGVTFRTRFIRSNAYLGAFRYQTFPSITSICSWLSTETKITDDSKVARYALNRQFMDDLKKNVSDFYVHMADIDNRIDDYDMKETHFIEAFIKGLSKPIHRVVAPWFDSEALRVGNGQLLRLPSATEVRDYAMMQERYCPTPKPKPEKVNKLDLLKRALKPLPILCNKNLDPPPSVPKLSSTNSIEASGVEDAHEVLLQGGGDDMRRHPISTSPSKREFSDPFITPQVSLQNQFSLLEEVVYHQNLFLLRNLNFGKIWT